MTSRESRENISENNLASLVFDISALFILFIIKLFVCKDVFNGCLVYLHLCKFC